MAEPGRKIVERREPRNLEELLDRIADAAQGRESVTVGNMVQEIGRQSFGPLFLFAGLIAFSPLSGIPGIPTTIAVLVLLVSVQMLMGRHCFWLPRWLLARSLGRGKVEAALRWTRPAARFVDRLLRPRLVSLMENGGAYAVAAIATIVALGVPLLEILPFAATLAGAVFTLFGLSIVARDGALALAGFAFSALVFGFGAVKLFG